MIKIDKLNKYYGKGTSNQIHAVNDVSIKLRGDSDGVKSYNMMVELAASYFGISGNWKGNQNVRNSKLWKYKI